MATSQRTEARLLAAVLAIAGVVLIAIAIVYFAQTAHNLPSFFPGHVARVSAKHHYTKRGIAAVVVGALLLVGAVISLRWRPSSAR